MSRKLTRLVIAGCVAAVFTMAPTINAYAADRNVFAADAKFSGKVQPETGKPTTDALPGDRVLWTIINGEHTVRPDETVGAAWPTGANPSEKLTPESPKYAVTFDRPGKYHFYCELHDGMVGVIDVKDQTSSTTPPSTANNPSTTTTRPAVVPGPTTTTTSAPASSAGTKPPGAAAPAPTTTTTKPARDNKDSRDSKDRKKDDKPKQEETTTTTVAPPPPPVDIPDSAIIPVLPGAATGTTTQNGIEAPTSTPEGEAIALLKSKKSNGGRAMKLLILSGVGLGALGIGTAGYKWANRSSRYFPA